MKWDEFRLLPLAQLLGGGNAETPPPLFQNPSAGVSFMFVLLVLICGFAIWFYKRRGRMLSPAGELKILESRGLGGRQFLVLAACGNERFLLGVCPGRIDYLCPLEPVEVTTQTAELPEETSIENSGEEGR